MPKSLIVKTFEHEGQAINVSFTQDAFFNATKVAQAFGKRPADWLVLESTKEYIEAITRKLVLEKNQVVMVVNGGSSPGTWLHPKLGIVFARWLNVDFALWCDDQIEAILHGQQSQPQPHDTPTLSTEQWQVISDLIRDISLYCRRREGASHAAHERIRFAFGLRHSSDLLPQNFEEARADLEGLKDLAKQHMHRLITLDEEFITAVIRPPVSIRKVRAMAKKAVSQPLNF